MPTFLSKDISRQWLCVVLILIAATALTLPILLNGIPKGNDLEQHFQFALTFFDSISNGDLIPSLSTRTNHGFGDVGVRFYPPLSYYLLALLRVVTGSWHYAASLSFLLWFFLGGLGIFLWSREYYGNAASLAAAIAYLVVPYHVNEVYNASFFAEFAGAGILPFCFLFVSRVAKNTSAANIVGLGIAYAALVLTHLPTMLIGSAGLFVFSLFLLRPATSLRTLGSLVSSAVMGLALSSFYWIKVVSELDLVNHSGAEFIAKNYDFKFNFVAAYFSVSADVYSDRFLWMSDFMFAAALALFVPSLLFRIFYKPDRAESADTIWPAVAMLFLAVAMATPLSSVLWENIGWLQKIQFPFRWLVLVNVAGAFLVASGFRSLSDAFSSKARPIAILTAGLAAIAVAFTVAQVIRPALFIPNADFDAYVAGLSDRPSYNCWLAIWAKEEAFADRNTISVHDRSVSDSFVSSYERRFVLGAGSETTVRLPVFYYPHWHAEVNDVAVMPLPAEDGSLTVAVPADEARVRVFFQEPPIVKTFDILAAGLWLVGALLSIRLLYNYGNSYSDRELV